MNHCRWNLLPPVPDQCLAEARLPPLIVQLLYHRGITELAQLEPFLSIDSRLSANPFLLPDMERAVNRIYQALFAGENIAVYGDFDADGITATGLLVQALTLLGGKATPYIPHRLTEGYGVKITALEKLKKQGASLVITVDCGITAVPEVRKAKKLKLDIIVTDHHTPLPEIPEAVAVVNPKLPGSMYPFRELTGAGVAFKLAQALLQGMGKEPEINQIIDLAAIGTIADVAPLLGENRYIVKQGLKSINENPRLGIREIMAQTGLKPDTLDADAVSWIIAPRLNAAGRLEHAIASYKLLMTDSPAEAQSLAAWLEQKNSERQNLTSSTLTEAREQVLAQGMTPLLIASGTDYPVGITGLVAGRLTEEFYRPSIIIRTGEQFCSGSCRSIPEFNIILALSECSSLFTTFGGHSQAAGFTLPSENLPRLKEYLMQMATAQLSGVDLKPCIDIDAEAKLSDLGGNTFQMIQKLAPFGRGNPLPVFVTRRAELVDCRTMGNCEHLRLKLKQNGTFWEAVGFRLGNNIDEITSPLDIVYNLEIDNWQGQQRLRLNMLDFAAPGKKG